MFIGVASFFVGLVFMWGMVSWPYYDKGVATGYKIYYLCVSSVLYVMSFIIHVVAKSTLAKVLTAGGMAIFGMNLYIELFRDPTNWSNFDFAQLIIVGATTLVMVLIMEKLKRKWKH